MKMWTMPFAATLAAVLVAISQGDRAGHGADLHSHLARLLHGAPGEGESVEAHLDAAAALLELSPAQRKEVAAQLAAALPDLELRALALVQAHASQLELVHASELDEEALRAASSRVGAAHGELAIAAARLLRDVHRVLTPEQILFDAHMELFRFKSRHNDEIRSIVLPALERIDAQLTPQQAASWQGIRERIVEHAEATAETRAGD